MIEDRYLFIDGGYLRARYAEMMNRVFGLAGEFKLTAPFSFEDRNLFKRIFYYDCLHDIPRPDESEEQLQTRVTEQQQFFDAMQSLDGVHVRLGSLSGSSRKMRQKKVDVQLAVDMLDHAFRKNMSSVCLIAGDLDFVPVVDALVRFGTWVEVAYDPLSAAKDLISAADKGRKLTFTNYYSWSTERFCSMNTVPSVEYPKSHSYGEPAWQLLDFGKTRAGNKIRLLKAKLGYALLEDTENGPRVVTHEQRSVLENFFSVQYSPIAWSSLTVEGTK